MEIGTESFLNITRRPIKVKISKAREIIFKMIKVFGRKLMVDKNISSSGPVVVAKALSLKMLRYGILAVSIGSLISDNGSS